jgi:DNA-binding MarR family transcriptional regulator
VAEKSKTDEYSIGELDQLLVQLSRQVVHAVREQGLGGLSLSQLSVLKQVQRGSTSARDLSFGLEVSPAAVTKLVDQLVHRGLVTRIRSRTDRRSAVLSITAVGTEALEESARMRTQLIRALIKPLPRSDIEVLVKTLRHFVEVIPSVWR